MFTRKSKEVTGNKFLLTVAINDYQGTNSDLRGCLNDQIDVLNLFKGYTPAVLRDTEATVKNVKKKLQTILNFAQQGDKVVFHYSGHGTQVIDHSGDEQDKYDEALYLYDGILIDEELGEILDSTRDGVDILLLMDCCFSGTISRSDEKKGKFLHPLNTAFMQKKKTKFKAEQMPWIIISGSKEDQTSQDAYINKRWNGAFTYYLCKSAKHGQSIREWFRQLNKTYIHNYQTPTLEGSDFNRIFF